MPRQAFRDYELVEEIARGGMGVVYKARQLSLDRTVALKVILSGHFASQEEVQRFKAEAQAAANLQHPNIVAIHEVGESDGQHYFTMEYVRGRNLNDLVREKPLPAVQAARYVRTIAQAAHYAHQQGVLHRDFKPSNVLIDDHDQPRVTDFGLAKRLDHQPGLTTSGKAIGSPGYMPPEQAVGQCSVGPASDVYSLGALLYHLLTGRAPFSAETVQATLTQVLHNNPVSPRALNPNVARDLETICLKCLEKDMPRRYPSAQALADELGRFLDGKPIHARPIGTMGKSWRWCRRNPVVAGLTLLAALLFVAGLAGVLWQWRRAEHYARRESLQRAQAERALTQLEMQYLADKATNGLAYARLARRIMRLEGYEEEYRLARAEFWSRRGIETSPELPEVWLARADVLLKQRDPTAQAQALAAVNTATEKNPPEPEAWFRQGQFLRDRRLWPEAVYAFRKAMELSPAKNRSPYRRAATALQNVLFDWKPVREATAALLSILDISDRDPSTPKGCVDLGRHFNAGLSEPWVNRALPGNQLRVLPTGRQSFGRIEFDVRGIIQVASKSTETLEPGFPQAVRGIEVGRACRRLHFLHATAFAYQLTKEGNFVGYGEKLGSYVIRYTDATTNEIALVSGQNIDEWHVGTWSVVDLPQARVAWEDHIDIGAKVRLFVFTWENPRPEIEISYLDFVSAMKGGAPFLIAITADD